jgi:hypothetical protein
MDTNGYGFIDKTRIHPMGESERWDQTPSNISLVAISVH